MQSNEFYWMVCLYNSTILASGESLLHAYTLKVL